MLEVDNLKIFPHWIKSEMTTDINHHNNNHHQNRIAINNGKIKTSSAPMTIPDKKNMSLHLNEHSNSDSKLNNIHEDDELSPLPEDLSSSLSNSPKMSPCLSPISFYRQRSHTIDTAFQRSYQRTKSTPASIPKDPIQPKCGSIGDIHSHGTESQNEEDEEIDDFFSDLAPMRSRSQTCPDSIMHKRKLKVRSLRRPSTPPPSDLCTGIRNMALPSDVDKEIDILVKVDHRL